MTTPPFRRTPAPFRTVLRLQRRRGALAALACTAACALPLASTTAIARAADPPENLPLPALPAACSSESSLECEHWMVAQLNAAHAKLGLSSYALPSDFFTLTPDKQIFILADLDRTAYGYTPISGLNTALDSAARTGVEIEDDPSPPSVETPWEGFGSDWADTGALRSYYLWMYDDGWNSPNLDCTSPGAAGCWGHRHVILGEGLYLPQPEVLGVSSGESDGGEVGTALIVSSHPDAQTYYTWAQAESEGAAGGGEGGEHKGEEGSKGKEGSEGEEGSKGGKGSKEGGEGSKEGGEGSKGEEGSKEKGKGEEGEPLACRISGSGPIGPWSDRSAYIYEQLTAPKARTERLEGSVHTPSRWLWLRLTDLTSASCQATHTGYEFRGQGTGTLGGAGSYRISFSFQLTRSAVYVSLEVAGEAGVAFKVSDAAMGAGSTQRLWASSYDDAFSRYASIADRHHARRVVRRTVALRRASRARDLKAARRQLARRRTRLAAHHERR